MSDCTIHPFPGRPVALQWTPPDGARAAPPAATGLAALQFDHATVAKWIAGALREPPIRISFFNEDGAPYLGG